MITSAKRNAVLPDLPTMVEAGYPEMVVVGWNAVYVPPKTPSPVILKIHSDIANVLQLRDVKERILAADFEPAATTVDEFAAYAYAKVNLASAPASPINR